MDEQVVTVTENETAVVRRQTQKQSLAKIQKLTCMAVLCALIAVTAFVPIKTLGAEITLCLVPVAVGAALFGPAAGAFLGAVFGFLSFFQTFGYSPFGAAMLSISPVLTFLVCVPTRIGAGFLAGVFAKLLQKAGNGKKGLKELSYPVCALSAPVLNTVFFMTVLCLCFYNSDYIQGFVQTLNAPDPFMFVILFVGLNGVIEIAAGFLVAYPVTRALVKVLKLK